MGPRLVTAEGRCGSTQRRGRYRSFNGAAVGYRGRFAGFAALQLPRKKLQWGRGWLPRKVLSEHQRAVIRGGASMGPRLVTAEGYEDTCPSACPPGASMGPRLVTAEGTLEVAVRNHAALASMGPRLVTAEGQMAVTKARSGWVCSFNGAAVGYRGRWM